MTATEREIAAFWIGFGAAVRGALGPEAADALYPIISPQMFGGDDDRIDALKSLIAELPAWPSEELRALFRQFGAYER